MKRRWLILPLFLALTVTNAQDTTTSTEVIEDVAANDTIVDNTTDMGADTIAADTTVTNDTITNEVVTNTESTNVVQVPVSDPADVKVENIGYIVTNDDILFASPLARFEVQGVDEQSGLKEILVSVDGRSYAPYRNPISFDTEGEHSLNYQFIDRVGNVSYSKTFSVTVDATPPRVVELNLTPKPYLAAGNVYVGPNTEISFTAYDDMVGVAFVEYGVNTDEKTRFISNTTFSSIGHTNSEALRVQYQAIDMVSNISPVKSQIINLDATAPVVNVFAKAVDIDGVRYISSKDTIYAEAFDKDTKVVEILYSVNGGEFKTYNAEIGIHLMEAGEQNVLVKAIDAVGNVSEEVPYNVVVDMLPPTGDAFYVGVERSEQYNDVSFLNEQQTQDMAVVSDTTSDTQTTPTSQNTADTTIEGEGTSSTEEIAESENGVVSPDVPVGTEVDVVVPE